MTDDDDVVKLVISRDEDGRLSLWYFGAKIRRQLVHSAKRSTARWLCEDPHEFDGSTSTKGCLGSLQINQKGTFELRRVEEASNE